MTLPRLAAAAALLLSTLPAHALTFRGSFEGVAHVEPILGGDPNLPSSYYDGATVTGFFSADIPDAHLAAADPTWYIGLGGGRTNLVFDIRGREFRFPSVPEDSSHPALIWVGGASDDFPYQRVAFYDSFFLKYHGAGFTFQSPPETLFRNGDLSTLAINADTVSSFSTYFIDASAYIAVNIDIRSFSFDPNVAAPVPEPPAWALLGMGLAAAALGARRRRA